MHRVWRGEPVNGGTLSIWPGCEGGPPILMGAWRSPRWITYAAQECQGWTPSGRYSSWEDLEAGMRICVFGRRLCAGKRREQNESGAPRAR
jgi:hypothetical protein